jgi:tetratricopeptide (TPR) repeat protein
MRFSWEKQLIGWAVVLVVMAAGLPIFAQTGELSGKCTDEKGAPMAGHIILIDRHDIKGTYKTKTDKKGNYVYLGLKSGSYKVTLQSPSGQDIFFQDGILIKMGETTEENFDMAKEKAYAAQHQADILKANPELQRKMEEQAKEAKSYTNLKEVFDLGVALYNNKQYAEAADIFEKAMPLAKGNNQGVVLSRLADCYGKAQKFDKALEYYPKAIAASPTDATLHNNLGDVYARMGKLPEAQAEFQKAVELNPGGASQYYFNLGALMYNMGKMDEAAAALKKATDVDPKNAEAFYWEALALMGKASVTADGRVTAPPGTAEALDTYLKLEPNGPHAAEAQSMLQTLQGKIDTQYKAPPKKKG